MRLQEEIEKLLKNQDETVNDLLIAILKELKEINKTLKQTSKTTYNKKGRDYYNFINKLRKDLRADVDKNIYPEIIYNNKKIGVTFNGYLYDKETNNNLRAFEAYEIYDFLYKNRNRLNDFIIKNPS